MECPKCQQELMLDRRKCSIDCIDGQHLILRTTCHACNCFIQLGYSSPYIAHAGGYDSEPPKYTVYI